MKEINQIKYLILNESNEICLQLMGIKCSYYYKRIILTEYSYYCNFIEREIKK